MSDAVDDSPEPAEDAATDSDRAPDGALRWPAPDRDSPQIGEFKGRYTPSDKLGALLRMDGQQGRSEEEVKRVTGVEIKRPRRWHKIFERMGILYPGDGVTRLARVGRMLRDAADPNGLQLLVAREVIEVLKRYQFDNPVEHSLPPGCDVHPYYIVLRATSLLNWRIHWDEVNRELMRITKDYELDEVIKRINEARSDSSYDDFIGKASNSAGLLSARTHPSESTAPAGKTPEGQLRDQRMTPFLKRVGFGELLLESPGSGGGGYWTVPVALRDLVHASVMKPPAIKKFSTQQEWIEWFCEGTSTATVTIPPPPPLKPFVSVASLTVASLRTALDKYEPDLVFSDNLLASLVAALRAGDNRSFIILRGVSGTGKSRLVAALAKAVYGADTVDMPYLTMVEVRPDWTDGSSLLGYYDPVGGRYVRQRFLDALLSAEKLAEAVPLDAPPVFLCLDEMNLARVEYYLADCLSAMESGNPMPLDTRGDPSLASSIKWASNLYLFGTVNIDETTLRISDKVLDRAQVIDTSDIELLPQLSRWLSVAAALDSTERERVLDLVGGAWQILRSVDAQFGFRTARAIVRFVNEAKASSGGAMTVDDAIDAQLVQKVLVKLRGEGERWAKPLEDLEKHFGLLEGHKRSHSLVSRMRDDLERMGSFQFWH